MLQAEKHITIEQNYPKNILKTISRTLKTAKLIDAFWERWLVHGLDLNDLNKSWPELQTVQQWFQIWGELALTKERMALESEKLGLYKEAEDTYRQAALYYNLNYWINPMPSEEKKFWYSKCLKIMHKADSISEVKTLYRTIDIGDGICAGRMRIPNNPKGCILIINPIDSSKEELYQYEMDFVNEGFISLSFDGPGQGETFILNEVIGTRIRWENFINQLIEFASITFPDLPIYLFGISLGASWVLYGSSHRKVTKAVAVSPAVELEKMNMPAYFMNRMECSCIVGEKERAIPLFNEINYRSPILVFHGNKDLMVPDEKMYELYQKISCDKNIIEYKEEGHCCNNRLDEIRILSIRWFSDKLIEM